MTAIKAEVDLGLRFVLKFSADGTLVSIISYIVDILKALVRIKKKN